MRMLLCALCAGQLFAQLTHGPARLRFSNGNNYGSLPNYGLVALHDWTQPGSSTTITDLSGHSNDLTVGSSGFGGTWAWRTYSDMRNAVFSGVSPNIISGPGGCSSGNLNILGNQGFTLALYMNNTVTSATQLFSIPSTGGHPTEGDLALQTSGAVYFGGYGNGVQTANGVAPVNTWQYIVIVHPAGANISGTLIYINGVLTPATFSGTDQPYAITTGQWCIGANANTSDSRAAAWVAFTAVWNRALTPSEVARSYQTLNNNFYIPGLFLAAPAGPPTPSNKWLLVTFCSGADCPTPQTSGLGNIESFTSTDLQNWTLLTTTYKQGATNCHGRDPGAIYIPANSIYTGAAGKYWMWTTGADCAQTTSNGANAQASSVDGSTWVFDRTVTWGGGVGTDQMWAPQPFIDLDGTLHLIISDPDASPNKLWESHPTGTDFSAWSAPVAFTWAVQPASLRDPYVLHQGSQYVVYYALGASGIRRAISTTLTGTNYTDDSSSVSGYDGAGGEGPQVFQVTPGRWRWQFDASHAGLDAGQIQWYESSDMKTWTSTGVVIATGGVQAKQGTIIPLQ